MDIEFLLFLQTLRTQTVTCLSDIAFAFDKLGFGLFLPLGLCIIIYWCCNKKIGEKLFLSFSISLYLSNFVKCIACVNRPWIRDPRIKPHPRGLKAASGYSFPSGHAASATATYGTLEKEYNKTNIIFHFICPVIILGVMLGRMLLGYHTPQDVLGGFAIGFISIFVASALVDHCTRDKKAWLLPFIFFIIALASAYYLEIKSYPVTPSVSPTKMRIDAQASMVALFVYLLSSTLENRFINFTPPSSFLGKILVFVPGFAMVYAVHHFGVAIALRYLPPEWAYYAMYCFLIAFIIFIWPAFFCHFTGQGTGKARSAKRHKH